MSAVSYNQTNINLSPNGGGGGSSKTVAPDFSVNIARVSSGYSDGSIVLSTGGQPPPAPQNPPGAFNGGGVGNKAIFGVFGFSGLPITQISDIRFIWENVVGPSGPNAIPPEPATMVTPAVNFIVDFGGGDIRVVVVCTDQLAPAISNSVGTYINNGSNVFDYSWAPSQNALIVLAPPNPVPGGVAPSVSVGPLWLENSYSWQSLVSANPGAFLVDAYSGDGGLPAGAVTPSILMVSGDSGTRIVQGKRIRSFFVNGNNVLA